MDISELMATILRVHAACSDGSVLVHCRNGANRSPLFCVMYTIARTGCSVEAALRHAYALRKLVDITPYHGTDPIAFLHSNWNALAAVLVGAGYELEPLPQHVGSQEFHTMLRQAGEQQRGRKRRGEVASGLVSATGSDLAGPSGADGAELHAQLRELQLAVASANARAEKVATPSPQTLVSNF